MLPAPPAPCSAMDVPYRPVLWIHRRQADNSDHAPSISDDGDESLGVAAVDVRCVQSSDAGVALVVVPSVALVVVSPATVVAESAVS